jgi:hypothetical protein
MLPENIRSPGFQYLHDEICLLQINDYKQIFSSLGIAGWNIKPGCRNRVFLVFTKEFPESTEQQEVQK